MIYNDNWYSRKNVRNVSKSVNKETHTSGGEKYNLYIGCIHITYHDESLYSIRIENTSEAQLYAELNKVFTEFVSDIEE